MKIPRQIKEFSVQGHEFDRSVVWQLYALVVRQMSSFLERKERVLQTDEHASSR